MRVLKITPLLLVLAVGFLAVQWLRERLLRQPFPAAQAQTLLHPARQRLMPVRRSLQKFGLQPGETVLELGPGPGYYSVEASRMVSSGGRLLCLDVQPGMIEALRGRLAEEGVENARLAVADATRLPLADSCVDRAFLVTVLGEVPDQEAALAELRRVLRPGGTAGFTETFTDPDYVFLGKLRNLCRRMGFEELHCSREPLGYTIQFRRR